MSAQPTPAILVRVVNGEKARVSIYVRPGGKSPAHEFLTSAFHHLKKRYDRFFEQFGRLGMLLVSDHQFKPLTDRGKGLFAIKQHDHRLFAYRGPDDRGKPHLVLLNGWVKDKDSSKGGCPEERREMDRAMALAKECQESVRWLAEPESTMPKAPTYDPNSQPPAEESSPPAPRVVVPPPPETTAGPVVPVPSLEELNKSRDSTDPLTTKALATLSGVPISAIWSMTRRGLLPGFLHGLNQVLIWPWDKADDLVNVIRKERLRTKAKQEVGQEYANKFGTYSCPRCGAEFPRGVQVKSHMTKCKVTNKSSESVPRKDLLKRFNRILDGKYDGRGLEENLGSLAALVIAWRLRVEKLEEELGLLKRS
jgi:hypothetical protein